MQARDDGFVSFSDGKIMFSELLYLAEGVKDAGGLPRSDSFSSSESSDSGRIQAMYGVVKRTLNSATDLLSATVTLSKKSSKKCENSSEKVASDCTQQRKLQAKSMASMVKSAEFVELAGGHCTGFLRCNALLPDAIMKSLDRLRKKTAAAA